MTSPPRHRRTVFALLAVVAAMAGLVAASVPLYRLYCAATGFGGTAQATSEAAPGDPDARTVTVRFDASVNRDMPWRFEPRQRQITVRLGETVLAYYTARNLSGERIIGTAVFNVTPAKAGRYFNKVECFCFSEQVLDPGQKTELPVAFFVDPALADDPDTSEIDTLTLSYTFFRAQGALTPAAKGDKAT